MRTAYIDLVGFGFTSQTSRFFTITAASRSGRYALPGLSDGAQDGHYLNNIKPINYPRSEGIDAVLLIVMVGLALLLFIVALLLMLRARDATVVHPPLVSGPGYTHDPRHADYYRQHPDIKQTEPAPKEGKPRRNDPRDVPLPKCPRCGTAVGFGEPKCVKCGYSLRPI